MTLVATLVFLVGILGLFALDRDSRDRTSKALWLPVFWLMIIGSPGGSYIPGMVILGTLAFMEGRSAQEIVGAPRFHHQYSPDVLQFESDALTPEERKALELRGHTLREGTRRWGNVQVVTWNYKTGQVEAASDPRGAGVGFVY